MSRDELIRKLNDLRDAPDPEHAHAEADRLLIGFINDPDVTEAYEAIETWYA